MSRLSRDGRIEESRGYGAYCGMVRSMPSSITCVFFDAWLKLLSHRVTSDQVQCCICALFESFKPRPTWCRSVEKVGDDMQNCQPLSGRARNLGPRSDDPRRSECPFGLNDDFITLTKKLNTCVHSPAVLPSEWFVYCPMDLIHHAITNLARPSLIP